MGFGGLSIGSLVVILVIVILLFGTKKLRNVGADLGGAIKSFKKAVTDEKGSATDKTTSANIEKKESDVIDVEVTKENAKDEKHS